MEVANMKASNLVDGGHPVLQSSFVSKFAFSKQYPKLVQGQSGTSGAGITSASHAEGPGFKS
eukprot:5292585-Amphidinium_carterae.1